MLKKIFTLCMLLATVAIHAAEPIIMTNTSLDLKLSLYPAESSKEGAIVFWTNKGEVERWSVTTASGKNYEMAVKSRYVVKQDGITKYMVKSSLDKDTFIKVFKNDLPVSVSFQIKGFANGQYATIDLPQDIKNHFASELENFNRPMALVQKFPPPPADTIKFMGIPMWGDVGLFAEKLKSKGFKVSWWKNEYLGYTYYCKGSFWRWKKTTCTIYSFDRSREISAIKVYIDGEEVEYAPKSQLKDMLILLKEKYGNGRILDSLTGESYEILRVLWSLKNGGVKFEYTWSRNSFGLKPTLELSYYTPKGLKSVFGETKTDGETNSEL